MTKKMTIRVVGASGATGIRLVEKLLNRGHLAKAIVRSPDKLPDAIKNHKGFTVVSASVLELSDKKMEQHVGDCNALASYLFRRNIIHLYSEFYFLSRSTSC